MRVLSIILTMSALAAAALNAAEVKEPALPLKQIAGVQALTDGVSVQEPVQIRDFLAQFEVRSGSGRYLVEGVQGLNLRLAEEAALSRVQALESDSALADKLAELAAAEPVYDGRTEGMRGRGPARYYRSREDQLVKNLIALQRPMLQPALEPRFNPTLRALSQKLQLDPYTTHPLLRAKLDRLVAAMVLDPALNEQILSVAKAPEQAELAVDERLWSTSPPVLQQQGIEAMMAMGVAFRASERFFGNPYISPTLALQWLEAQAALGPMPGADAMVMLGVAAESEAEIRMLITQLRWAAQFDHQDDPIMAFNVQRQAPTFRTRANRIVVLLPAEYLSWTKPFAEFAERPDMLGAQKLIWITGKASAAATAGLKQTGWTLRSGVELPPWTRAE